jgi:hypothetical protein
MRDSETSKFSSYNPRKHLLNRGSLRNANAQPRNGIQHGVGRRSPARPLIVSGGMFSVAMLVVFSLMCTGELNPKREKMYSYHSNASTDHSERRAVGRSREVFGSTAYDFRGESGASDDALAPNLFVTTVLNTSLNEADFLRIQGPGRCLNPHPGPFRTWNGQQNGCFVQIWRQWEDGCTHYQWYNACSGTPAGPITWTYCVH